MGILKFRNDGVIWKMGNSLILKEEKAFNLQMVNFQELQISQFHNFEMGILKFRNDGVIWKIETLGEIDTTHKNAFRPISQLSQNPRFLSTQH